MRTKKQKLKKNLSYFHLFLFYAHSFLTPSLSAFFCHSFYLKDEIKTKTKNRLVTRATN